MYGLPSARSAGRGSSRMTARQLTRQRRTSSANSQAATCCKHDEMPDRLRARKRASGPRGGRVTGRRPPCSPGRSPGSSSACVPTEPAQILAATAAPVEVAAAILRSMEVVGRHVAYAARPMARDLRLDVWRGLCLVDVVLVHLAYNGVGFPAPLDDLIKHYTRFAAGGFVFLSGLTIGVVFGTRLARSPVDRMAVYRWSLRRAAVLLVVDMLAAVAFQAVDGLRRFPVTDGATVVDTARELLLLQRAGIGHGILLLYALLLAALPLVLELRRRLGTSAVAALSLALYAVAQGSEGLRWPGNEFPIAWWQPLFVAGLLSDGVYRRACRAGRGWRAGWTGVALAGFALVFLVAHGPALGVVQSLPASFLDFTKTPLRPGALLWYLAIVQLLLAVTSLCWRGAPAPTPVVSFLTLLGRHSLLVYVAHVFTEAAVLEYVWSTWPGTMLRMVAVVADLAALFLLCAAVEWWPKTLRDVVAPAAIIRARPARPPPPRPRRTWGRRPPAPTRRWGGRRRRPTPGPARRPPR